MDIKVAESLPRSLGAMYERILTNMDDCSKCMAHRILRFVMFARRPLSVPELADAIAINETTKTMHDLHRARLLHPEDIFVICGSRIRRSEVTGHVLLAHLLSSRVPDLPRCPANGARVFLPGTIDVLRTFESMFYLPHRARIQHSGFPLLNP